jgi:1-acyl-sn-glycerol-3-phosphate acyltransferase
LQKVHRGVSFIVHNANVPTIPVFLKGGERLMPRDSKYPSHEAHRDLWSTH